MEKLIFIVGPTASGKSSLAIEIAKKLNGEIISSDSMQIYKNMNIGTAKTTKEEMQNIPHYFQDIVNSNESFDVATYQKMALKKIEEIKLKNKQPIFVGGTGLYVNSVLYPLSFGKKDRDEDLRNELKDFLFNFGNIALFEMLKEVDLKSAEKLHPNDVKRVIRAIEIAKSDKISKSKLNELQKPRFEYVMIGLNCDRKLLYDRINQRVDEMFENGLVEEVDTLLKSGTTFDCQSMQAIGYKEFAGFYESKYDLEETKELIKKHTRNYAKRQITWFKKYENIKWFDLISERDKAIEYAINEITGDKNEL